MSKTIKDIPSTDAILFSSVVGFHDRSLLGITSLKSVKMAITNTDIYIKIAGVLIDTTGTQKMAIDQVTKILVKTPLVKSNRFLTLFNKAGGEVKFTVTADECLKIVQILTDNNPNIHVNE